MRLLIILLFLPLLVQAQNDEKKSIRLHLLKKAKTTAERPVRFHFYGTYGLPVGGFSSSSNNTFVVGQGREGGGVAMLFSFPVYKSWHIGVYSSFLDYSLDEIKVQTQVRARYLTNGYITAEKPIRTQHRTNIGHLGLAVSKMHKLWFLGIEPCVIIGPAFVGIRGDSKLRQHNIQANDVEFINLNHRFDNNMILFGSAGVRMNMPLFKWRRFNFSAGVFYTTTSSLETEFTATRVDFYSNTNIEEQFSVKNNLSAFHLDFGLQLKLWKTKHDEE